MRPFVTCKRSVVSFGVQLSVMYVNPKHEISHKPLALCRSLLSSIGPFSAPQAEYSAYTYSIQNNRATAAVKLENTSNTTP